MASQLHSQIVGAWEQVNGAEIVVTRNKALFYTSPSLKMIYFHIVFFFFLKICYVDLQLVKHIGK